jgi:hypothetical protein
VPARIENKLHLTSAFHSFQTHFADKGDQPEEDPENLEHQQTFGRLGTIRVFETEVRSERKRLENNDITEYRRKHLSIA